MGAVLRLVLDTLKPHEPSIIELAQSISDLPGVDSVNISIYEIDRKVENAKITVEGPDIQFSALKALLQETIDDVYEQFLETVWRARSAQLTRAYAQSRRVDPENVSERQAKSYLRGIADGRVLSGRQALRAGLIDELGGLERAIESAASLAGLRGRPGVVTQKRRRATTWRDLIGVVLGLVGRGQGPPSGERISLEYMLR